MESHPLPPGAEEVGIRTIIHFDSINSTFRGHLLLSVSGWISDFIVSMSASIIALL